VAANLEEALSGLKGATAVVSRGNGYPEPGHASIHLLFSSGTRLGAEYWRLVVEGKAGISSFDHHQRYGLPAPIDAVNTLHDTLQDKLVTNAFLDIKTGDLFFEFACEITLQVFNFTGYEIWHIRFLDGAEEYSNYNK